MAFGKLSYYLYNAKVVIKCDHVPLQIFLTADIFNSKVNNWGTEIANISHLTCEHTKGTANIVADHIFRLRSMGLYMRNPEERGKFFGHFTFDEVNLSITTEQEGSVVSVNQIQHVPIELDHDEIKRLQQEDLQLSKIVRTCKETMKQSVEISV